MTMQKRILSLLLLFLSAASALQAVCPSADITGTGATIQLAVSGSARWVQIIADSSNTAAVRTDQSSTVSATIGAKVPAGAGFMYPFQGQNYSLANIYVYIASGDKISVICGNQ
jgi:hypothetical protein